MTAARRFGSLVSAILAAELSVSAARADSGSAAAAEALFDEGRRLVEAHRYDEACAKFEASQRLDPGVGTLLNLGDCLERAGRTASAWTRFREAASLAVEVSQHAREREARDRARAIEGRLVRLVVRATDDVRILRDGIVVDRAVLGTAVPVDPGAHVVRATATGKKPWSTELRLDEPGTTKTVEVPPLADEPAARAITTSVEKTSAEKTSPQKTIGIVVLGLGVAALGVGGGLSLNAKSVYDDARNRCTPAGCDAVAQDRANGAYSQADVATGLFIGGAIAIVAGVALFVTAR